MFDLLVEMNNVQIFICYTLVNNQSNIYYNLNIWYRNDSSGNLNSSFDVGADILNLWFLSGYLVLTLLLN